MFCFSLWLHFRGQEVVSETFAGGAVVEGVGGGRGGGAAGGPRVGPRLPVVLLLQRALITIRAVEGGTRNVQVALLGHFPHKPRLVGVPGGPVLQFITVITRSVLSHICV